MPRPRKAPAAIRFVPTPIATLPREPQPKDRVAATYDELRTGTVERLLVGGAEVRWADGLVGWAPSSMLMVLS